MTRKILSEEKIHAAIKQKVSDNHRDIVEEVQSLIEQNEIVIIGMGWNPHCRTACKTLDGKFDYKYVEYGNYLSPWRRRNALKMWSGWPTFPMVFVKGVLVGGADDLQRVVDKGELEGLLG